MDTLPKYFRLKKGAEFDPLKGLPPTAKQADEVSKEVFAANFLNGSCEFISYGVSRNELEAIIEWRKKKLSVSPANEKLISALP